jgi:hypothetical protein
MVKQMKASIMFLSVLASEKQPRLDESYVNSLLIEKGAHG